ncbi:50S ribosomal protein L28 [Candidatus Kaiserbacteria bacterium RIFCSPHIGHO2_02_FULL_55_25]|uniref:Large ribosomal subunit protein bL28 n=1 Tax=Candidatus Kaiserbacteria bacterium RIFCSPHIGHO2_02_FULL_55_25 TaxID=1798498 RepID=A0A1F6E6M6_9BACT|nr:MAG: 50S ribosomal protein L28 [Candidatus Kaiserbacteria bacterium RIFCSPHIGHO2_01_FULL_55_79]OGG69281.1 MAG: 50S ribosomal protein L28 [Candidatus Kaiserbacteria bacterium RIFCSPHIGHO2_02_FULL_55_25]OGG77046.1 MAG: 50S ribosomal protein L28 [Candidatus Kaiserbacteria bacterium RIFCSPHIGHO2_12_FULL_55_13]OGG83916.1 MAG: 50S ribosomal protein L28 [Candidatus Kaiserbacteria bacterium RIFCSPLOWO2_01_FULL_55_25]
MARVCEITGSKSQVGGGYSNRVRATKFNPTGARRRQVNLQSKTLFIPELGKKITVRVSAKGLKTMKKRGAYKTLKKAGLVN